MTLKNLKEMNMEALGELGLTYGVTAPTRDELEIKIANKAGILWCKNPDGVADKSVVVEFGLGVTPEDAERRVFKLIKRAALEQAWQPGNFELNEQAALIAAAFNHQKDMSDRLRGKDTTSEMVSTLLITLLGNPVNALTLVADIWPDGTLLSVVKLVSALHDELTAEHWHGLVQWAALTLAMDFNRHIIKSNEKEK